MANLKTLFGAQVRSHRIRMGWTQAKLARQVDLSLEMIGKIERGTAGASFGTIDDLCKAFGIQPSELFPDEGLAVHGRSKGTVGDIMVQLSRLNENELQWVQRLLKEALRKP